MVQVLTKYACAYIEKDEC